MQGRKGSETGQNLFVGIKGKHFSAVSFEFQLSETWCSHRVDQDKAHVAAERVLPHNDRNSHIPDWSPRG